MYIGIHIWFVTNHPSSSNSVFLISCPGRPTALQKGFRDTSLCRGENSSLRELPWVNCLRIQAHLCCRNPLVSHCGVKSLLWTCHWRREAHRMVCCLTEKHLEKPAMSRRTLDLFFLTFSSGPFRHVRPQVLPEMVQSRHSFTTIKWKRGVCWSVVC